MAKKSKMCRNGKPIPVNIKDRLYKHNPNESTFGDITLRNVKRIRVKCSVCKRRMLADIRICHDGCCLTYILPPHKIKYWWKKGKKRK